MLSDHEKCSVKNMKNENEAYAAKFLNAGLLLHFDTKEDT